MKTGQGFPGDREAFFRVFTPILHQITEDQVLPDKNSLFCLYCIKM